MDTDQTGLVSVPFLTGIYAEMVDISDLRQHLFNCKKALRLLAAVKNLV